MRRRILFAIAVGLIGGGALKLIDAKQAPVPATDRLEPTENQRLRLTVRLKDAQLLQYQASQALAAYQGEARQIEGENLRGICTREADIAAGKCVIWPVSRVEDVQFDPNTGTFQRVAKPAATPAATPEPVEPQHTPDKKKP